MKTGCTGNLDDHCCYLGHRGEDRFGRQSVCPFLEENTVAGRRWSCGLYNKLGSWDKVHRSRDYKQTVQPMYDEMGGGSCGDWPPQGQVCAVCGNDGTGGREEYQR